MRGGWVYIVTNRPDGILYLGVTSNLGQRAWQHRAGVYPSFTKRYGLGRLVWYKPHDDIARRDPARAHDETLVARLEGARHSGHESVVVGPVRHAARVAARFKSPPPAISKTPVPPPGGRG